MPKNRPLSFALTWEHTTEPVALASNELLYWLGKKLGREVVPCVARSYEDIFPLFEHGHVDFAWLPPLVFLRLRMRRLARTMLVNDRHTQTTFHAALVVRTTSRYCALDRLARARIAWVDPHSATGYVLQRIDLAARGIDPRNTFSEERFFGSHDAAARAVFDGQSDVLATFAEYDGDNLMRAGFSSTGSSSMWRVLMRGRECPSDVLAARSTIDDALNDAVRAAFFEGLTHPYSAQILHDVFHVHAFRQADDSRYAILANTIDRAQRDGLLPNF